MFDNLRDTLKFDDLLFEKRNKEYGAYQLRKKYNAVIIAGVILSSLLISAAVLIPFFLSRNSEKVLSTGIRYVQVKMENLEPPVDEIYVPPPPPPPEAVKAQENLKYVPPVVVDTVYPLETKQATTDEFLAQTTNDITDIKGTGTGDNLLSGQDGVDSDEPFFHVEVMPSFKGGDINKFREWVQQRTNYPQAAIDNRIQGRVFLTFIVETDGSVSNVTVVKGVAPIIDNEAVKAIQSSPKWSPGLQRGKPVRVRYLMPLLFKF
jgi:periplasmic protein TonB